GGGEEGILNAAAAQIANFYDLPSSVSGGMTDAKLPDNQAGYEKGINVTLAALAGANSVSEAAGMMGSLMGCSFESIVIDNDMIGCIQRALRGIEVTDETLSFEVIRDVVLGGPGHFLSHQQTLGLMQSEYLYPEVADRSSIEDWEAAGSPDIREHARARVQQILSSHYPQYIAADTDRQIRELFPIHLPQSAMQPGSGRWVTPA
ncbi:MAG TPA: methyltransferase, partial [Gammaproteobacteria bacterium]|nr:methyltransferase [Gammaproteobacteria bacterium]